MHGQLNGEMVYIDYQLTFCRYKLDDKTTIPFTSGYDGIVFIDLWKDIKQMEKLLKDMKESIQKIERLCT